MPSGQRALLYRSHQYASIEATVMETYATAIRGVVDPAWLRRCEEQDLSIRHRPARICVRHSGPMCGKVSA